VALAQQSEVELEQQRTENSVLKETIDKLKLDLDEIRSGKIVDPSMSVSYYIGLFIIWDVLLDCRFSHSRFTLRVWH